MSSECCDDEALKVLDQDRLGRSDFIGALRSSILRPPGAVCRVISVEGAWGEGKSSSVEMAIDQVGLQDSDLRPFIVRLNPWQLGSKDRLVHALLSEFSAIASRDKKSQTFVKVVRAIEEYQFALEALQFAPSGGLWTVIAKLAIKVASRAARDLGDVEKRKEAVAREIKEAGRPIVIILDDLDRLLPSEFVEVVRFVRAVADFPQTTYVLLYDHARAIELLGAAGVPSPALFLDKIVQFRMHLPPASRNDIASMLLERLSALDCFANRREFDDSEYTRYRVLDVCVVPILRDVRSINRLVDRLRSIPPRLSREVEFWDLLGLNFLAIKAPAVFAKIRAEPSVFTDKASLYPMGTEEAARLRDQIKEQVQKSIAGHSPSERVLLSRLIDDLFPVFEGSKSSPGSDSLRLNGRIGEGSVLMSALSYGDKKDISLEAIESILRSPDSRQANVQRFATSPAALDALARSLHSALVVRRGPVQDPLGLLVDLVTSWAHLRPSKFESDEAFDSYSRQLLPIITALLEAAPSISAYIDRLRQLDADGILTARVLDLISKDRSIANEFKDKCLPSDFERWSQHLERVARTTVLNVNLKDYERSSALLYILRRVSKAGFDRIVGQMVVSKVRRRSLICALGLSVRSGKDGRVARWSDDLRKDLVQLSDLEKEARAAIKEGGDDSLLIACSRALVENKAIVVSTGADYEM